MNEKKKAAAGLLYDANYDPELISDRLKAKSLCYDYNRLHPSETEKRKEVIRKLFARTGKVFLIEQPFQCDYGYNIEIGERFYMNMGGIILDAAKIVFGNDVFIGPNCGFYAAGHPLDPVQRNKGLEYAKPIKIGDNVWIGGNVAVLPGITIGENTVIGAGSIVTKDIPPGVLAFGNPCKIVRKIMN